MDQITKIGDIVKISRSEKFKVLETYFHILSGEPMMILKNIKTGKVKKRVEEWNIQRLNGEKVNL